MLTKQTPGAIGPANVWPTINIGFQLFKRSSYIDVQEWTADGHWCDI